MKINSSLIIWPEVPNLWLTTRAVTSVGPEGPASLSQNNLGPPSWLGEVYRVSNNIIFSVEIH